MLASETRFNDRNLDFPKIFFMDIDSYSLNSDVNKISAKMTDYYLIQKLHFPKKNFEI